MAQFIFIISVLVKYRLLVKTCTNERFNMKGCLYNSDWFAHSIWSTAPVQNRIRTKLAYLISFLKISVNV